MIHVPLGYQVMNLLRLSPFPGFEVTPVLFNATSGVCLVAFYRYTACSTSRPWRRTPSWTRCATAWWFWTSTGEWSR